MLLRSSSTPILSSLGRGAVYHERGVFEDESPSRSRPFKTVTFSPSLAPSPSPQHFRDCDETSSLDGGDWDFDAEIMSRPSFRRVRSDTDLHSLTAWLSTSSSLPTSPKANHVKSPGFREGEHWLSNGSRLWSRRMSLKRQSSLSVISSNSDSGLESDTFASGPLPDMVKSGSFEECGEIEFESPVNVYGLENQSDKDDSRSDYAWHTLDKHCLSSPVSTSAEVATLDESTHEFSLPSACTRDIPSLSGRDAASCPEGVNCGTYTTDSPTAGNGITLFSSTGGCKLVTESVRVGPVNLTFEVGGGGGGGGGGGRPTPRTGTVGGGGESNDSSATETFYMRALKTDPGNSLLLGNYAKFLQEVKLDSLKAEHYYERAILANPGDGELLAQYAKLIWDVYVDEERAGHYFEQALQASPDNCYVVAAYASFLWGSESNEEESQVEAGHSSRESPNFSPIFNNYLAAPVAS